jgi:DNA-binding MarR family transcriptional regulator
MPTELEALGRSVKQLQYRHHRAMETRLVSIGSTLAQWDALRAIDRNPGASAHILAEATFQSDQAFGTLANRLQKRGLIDRTPGHGRRISHVLTPSGKEMLRAGYPLADAVLTASFAALSASERATLHSLITRAIGDEPL